jgi:hypothetical protein
MRRKRIWICFGSAVAVLLLSPLLEGAVSAPVIRFLGDSMDWRSRWLMGRNGIDCGQVKVNGDPQIPTACALKAQGEGKPFRVSLRHCGL